MERQLIRIHLRDKPQPIEWASRPGNEETEASSVVHCFEEGFNYLRLEDEDGCTIVECHDIEAIEVVKDGLVQINSIDEFVRMALEHGCSPDELLRIVKDVISKEGK